MEDLTPEQAVAELQAFARALSDGKALERGAREARALVMASLSGRVSPDGTAWAPRKQTSRSGRRAYQRSTPRPTGRLESETDVRVEGATLVFDVPVEYAGFVQDGTEDAPARPFLPFDRSGEPMTGGAAGEFWKRLEEALADKPLEVLGGR